MVSLKNKMRAALRNMGRNYEQVAAYLAKRRVKGHRNSPTCCPIANYLDRAVPTKDTIIVDGQTVVVGQSSISLTKAQRDFVAAFDRGAFPKLEL